MILKKMFTLVSKITLYLKKISTIWKRGNVLRAGTWVLIGIGVIVIAYPFWPKIQYSIWPPADESSVSIISADEAQDATPNIPGNSLPIVHRAVPEGNRLIIQKIGVDIPLVDGSDEKTALNKGAWRLPSTSTPDKGGNTAVAAHRYKYRPPAANTFYLLDKLAVDDMFTVYWEGFEYTYKVTKTSVVEPTDVYVLDNTEEPIMTLITCTPLFTTKQRLVVVAKEIPY